MQQQRRPFITMDISGLLDVFHRARQRDDAETVRKLIVELSHRKSKRAKAMHANLTKLVAGQRAA